jgi:hypothetical protein
MSLDLAPLHPLRFAPLTFEIEATTDLHLPDYKGSALRGGFGNAFKKAVCLTRTLDCPPCFMQKQCAYYSIFESKIEKRLADMLRIGGDAPHPFVLLPPLTAGNTFAKGERLAFQLTVIGKAIEQLPFFLLALDLLGREIGLGSSKGKFKLAAVFDSTGKLVFDGEKKMVYTPMRILSAKEILEEPTNTNGTLRLNFQTPVRIKSTYKRDGQHLLKLSRAEDFQVLVESLYHRLFTLAQLYCVETPQAYDRKQCGTVPLNDVALTHSSIQWIDWERYSNRQQTRMKLGGFVGEAEFAGEAVAQYAPLFKLGEHLHLGKGSSFGLGKFVVSE